MFLNIFINTRIRENTLFFFFFNMTYRTVLRQQLCYHQKTFFSLEISQTKLE